MSPARSCTSPPVALEHGSAPASPAASIAAFGHDTPKLLANDFKRIGGVANDLLDRGAKPFMIKRFHGWLKKKLGVEVFGYNTLDKWYVEWRADMGDNVPDELPQGEPPKTEEVTTPPPGKEVTAEDCRRATAELAESMSMSQFDDENYEDGNRDNSPAIKT